MSLKLYSISFTFCFIVRLHVCGCKVTNFLAIHQNIWLSFRTRAQTYIWILRTKRIVRIARKSPTSNSPSNNEISVYFVSYWYSSGSVFWSFSTLLFTLKKAQFEVIKRLVCLLQKALLVTSKGRFAPSKRPFCLLQTTLLLISCPQEAIFPPIFHFWNPRMIQNEVLNSDKFIWQMQKWLLYFSKKDE